MNTTTKKNKNIVICSDGTGNSAIKGRGTNVFKLYEAIDLHNENTPQLAIYDDGVGTQSFKLFKILGGAFGFGLSRNVRQLYAELVRVYEPGDQVYLFGFSRGAFTVRTLGGFITTCGILKRDYPTEGDLRCKVKRAFRVYRKAHSLACLETLYFYLIGIWLQNVIDFVLEKITGWIPAFGYTSKTPSEFIQENSVIDAKHVPDGIPEIRFIGAWDTVSAVGFPVLWVSDLLNTLVYHFKFPDHKLNKKVQKACHALAIDDERATFHPLMWEQTDEDNKTNRIEQIWFSGVHANVGGGYPKQGVSLVSLDWMMERAHKDAGLELINSDRNKYHASRNIMGKIYDSRAGIAHYYRYLPRDLQYICNDKTPVLIHDSVIRRIANTTDGYYPGNIPREFTVVATDRSQTPVQVSPLVAEALGGDKSPLDRAWFWKYIRVGANYAFVILSLVAVYLTVKDELLTGTEGPIQILAKLFTGEGLTQLWKDLFDEPWLIGLIAAFLLIGLICKGRMMKIFSKFWLSIQSSLQKAIS